MARTSASLGPVFTQLAFVCLLMQGLAGLALILTGHWTHSPPDFLLTINPIIGLVDGLGKGSVLPETFLIQSPTYYRTAADLAIWATIQWLGLGLVIDFVRAQSAH